MCKELGALSDLRVDELLKFRGERTQRKGIAPTWCCGGLQTDGANTRKLHVFISRLGH